MVVQWKSDGILSFITDQLTTISPLLNNEAHPTINPPILTSGLVIWEIASVSAQVRETDSHHKLVGWSELSPPLLVPRCARSFLADTHCGSMALHLSSNISAPEAEHQTISDPPHFLWGDPWKWWVNMMKKTCLIKMVQVVWWTLVNLVKGSCRETAGKKRPWKSGTSIMRNSTKSINSYVRWVPGTIDLVYN